MHWALHFEERGVQRTLVLVQRLRFYFLGRIGINPSAMVQARTIGNRLKKASQGSKGARLFCISYLKQTPINIYNNASMQRVVAWAKRRHIDRI